MTTNLAVFAVAAVVEIAGCFAFWAWLRRGATPLVLLVGVASLIGFALVLTRVDSAFAGRAYAAYGDIYIAASLVWLWLVEGQVPTRADWLGATLAIVGALVIRVCRAGTVMHRGDLNAVQSRHRYIHERQIRRKVLREANGTHRSPASAMTCISG